MSEQNEKIKQAVIDQIKEIYDPEIPINIYELGLIYDVEITDNGECNITMTFTTPSCPTAGSIINEVNYRAGGVEGVKDVFVKLTWDPPWDVSRASERAQLELNEIMGIY